jgi:hypothetical protein
MKSVILIVTIIFIFSYSTVFAANPAPYTDEAFEKIMKATAATPVEYNPKLSTEERLRLGVEIYRNIFVKSGFNYEDTIIKVVNDMRNNPDNLPKGPQSTFTIIYVGLHFLLSECKYDKVDCLPFFRSDSMESVKWLMNNTEFHL